MIRKVDLNADAGEGLPEVDEALMQVVTSVSVACGGHAGDDSSMHEVCRLAAERGVRVGAHPSYPDRKNFGRLSMAMEREELVDSLREQISRLVDIAVDEGVRVAYVKPHGALYNDAARQPEIASAVTRAAGFLPVMLLASDPAADIREGFIDRAYLPDGSLKPRNEPGAVLADPEEAAVQAVTLASKVDSLCIHSDTPGAPDLAAAARRALEGAGYIIGA